MHPPLHRVGARSDRLLDRVEKANALLVMDALDSRVLVELSLSALIDDGTLTFTLHGGRFLVALPYILRMEEELAKTVVQGDVINPHSPGRRHLNT